MSETLEQLYVTDRDIFELLISSKQRMTHQVILDLVQDRNIFCSDKATREDVADYISMLPHDHNDLATLIEKSEQNNRLEKTTFVAVSKDVEIEDIKSAIKLYGAELNGTDAVSIPITGKTTLTANFNYDELDYSKTRLTQRQKKQAQVEVVRDDNRTVIRMPATEKARRIVEIILAKVAAAKKSEVPVVELDLTELTLPAQRTAFFTTLITSIPRHQLQTVTSVKVATFERQSSDEDFDDEVDDIRQDITAIVNKAALGGENIIATPQFRQFTDSGFFIVSVVWQSVQEDEPKDLIRFSLSFDDPVGGRGIKYVVRHASRIDSDRFSGTFKRLSDIRESALFRQLEAAATQVLKNMTQRPEDMEHK